MTTSLFDPASQENLCVLIGLVRAQIVRLMEAELVRLGVQLSFTQFLILKRLSNNGPMNAGELARAVELDAGAMTRQLDQLEHKGYLIRQPHQQDRRALRIELTADGAALCKVMSDGNKQVLELAQRTLSKPEQAQLQEYLERIWRTLRDKN